LLKPDQGGSGARIQVVESLALRHQRELQPAPFRRRGLRLRPLRARRRFP